VIKHLVVAAIAAVSFSVSAGVTAAESLPDMVDRLVPSIVVISSFETAKAEVPDAAASALQKLFPDRKAPAQPKKKPGPPPPIGAEKQKGMGSGFVIDSGGYIMTNAHVVEGAERLEVTLDDGKKYPATLVGSDPRGDIALLKITVLKPIPQVTMGFGRIRAGEQIFAVGAPFGLDYTVTSGIISNVYREVGDLLPGIQIDAAVNPGNSGGPLFNMKGEVIGVNSQIFSKTGIFAGIAFAIPIADAVKIANELRSTGKMIRGRLAVVIGEVDADVVKLNPSIGVGEGTLIKEVEAGGPSDLVGLKAGDVIVGFNGERNRRGSAAFKPEELPRFVGAHKPGERVTVQVLRKNEPLTFVVTLASDAKIAATPSRKPFAPDESAKP
jgi:serine protease Do